MNLSEETCILICIGAILVSWKYTRRFRVISFILLRRMYRAVRNYFLNVQVTKTDDLHKKNDNMDATDDDTDEENESPPL